MKTIVPCIFLFCFIQASAQSLSFTNPTLQSGTDLKKGAVYLFKNVTTGINATVTISDLVNGATINKIDDNGGGVGYLNAFQPEIKSGNKGESYAVFSVKFIEVATNSPYLLKTLQATALDIDGTSELKEFDEIDMNGGSASYMGGTLQISLKSLPIIGTLFNNFRADNITGVDKNGIDTASKGNMYTVTNSNVNSFTMKLGATTSTTSNIARQYSIYMMGFQYPNVAILPLKLLSFTASLKNEKAVLNWTTTEEDHVASFVVERSVDGIHFSDISSVSSKGNMTDITTYTLTDNDAITATTYYRLRCVDISGSFIYSSIQTIKTSAVTSSVSPVSAYPNPFSNRLTISYPPTLQGKQSRIDLFNNNGQLVKTMSVNASASESIETSSLERGIYIVRVSAGNNLIQYKVVKS
ncbi:MAG: T9SS type A sorting domain-containing protein [Chitinophagaceae bacterium]